MQINNCFLRFETAILTDIPKIRYGISVRYAASEHVIFTLIISYSRISVNENRVLGGGTMVGTAKNSNGLCVHHWILPAPGDKDSNGICNRCGAEKKFVDHSSNTSGHWMRQKGQQINSGR